ncbi:hypothetical protein BDZ94DRAFT_1243778, partial [Collybia nuda]
IDDAIHNAPLPHLRAFNIDFVERDRQGNLFMNDEAFARLKTATLLRMRHAYERKILDVRRVAEMHPELAFVDNE